MAERRERREDRETEAAGTEAGDRLIRGSVGQNGRNRAADVGAVQTALKRHGHDPGEVDQKIGRKTIRAIRRFQRDFMPVPDGLVEVGQVTEQHLVRTSPPPRREVREGERTDDEQEEEELADVSARGARQMQRLEAAADNAGGRRPRGMCYRAVKHHITNAGGYGNIRNIYNDPRFSGAQAEARMFAERVNPDPERFGLEKLSISNPYEAPEGSIIVVAAGSPGTRHRTAGDITVKGPGNAFYNDGLMNYGGRDAWPPRRGGVLGVYRPK